MRTIEAENAVIGSILIDPSCLADVSSVLTPADFEIEANRVLYESALALERNGDTVDPITIKASAGSSVSAEYVLALMDATPTAANAMTYAAETRKASMLRALEGVAAFIKDRVSQRESPRAVLGEVQRTLEQIETHDLSQEVATPTESMLAFLEHRNVVETGGGGFVPTGIRRLDTMLGGGMLNGGLYLLAARPGMGKTTTALTIADHIAKSGPVLFVSLEMSVEQISAKRVARETLIPASKLLMGELSKFEEARVVAACKELSERPFHVNRRPSATVDDVAHMARKIKGLRCIAIDYFGLLRYHGKSTGRYEAMTEISGQLKALARALDIPILCLAQLNRENMNRSGKKPQLSDLRDTGALEQDADGVIFIHRPDYYSDESGESDPTAPVLLQLILEKNRHASTGVCNVAFYLQTGRIDQLKTKGAC